MGAKEYVHWLASEEHNERKPIDVLKKEAKWHVQRILDGHDTFDTSHFGRDLSCAYALRLIAEAVAAAEVVEQEQQARLTRLLAEWSGNV